jgi:hypothetical protein
MKVYKFKGDQNLYSGGIKKGKNYFENYPLSNGYFVRDAVKEFPEDWELINY